MKSALILVIGFLEGSIGVIPPGLLNMTAAKVGLKEGRSRALLFSLGACIIIILQTTIALISAKYLTNHPDVVNLLQRVAFVIFVLITIYYLFFANKRKKADWDADHRSKGSRFFQGMFLSAINLFPLPFHAYMAVTLATWGWLSFSTLSIISYVTGAVVGSFVMFYIYIIFFDRIKSHSFTSQKNMNRIIGSITGLVALITLISIIMKML